MSTDRDSKKRTPVSERRQQFGPSPSFCDSKVKRERKKKKGRHLPSPKLTHCSLTDAWKMPQVDLLLGAQDKIL